MIRTYVVAAGSIAAPYVEQTVSVRATELEGEYTYWVEATSSSGETKSAGKRFKTKR